MVHDRDDELTRVVRAGPGGRGYDTDGTVPTEHDGGWLTGDAQVRTRLVDAGGGCQGADVGPFIGWCGVGIHRARSHVSLLRSVDDCVAPGSRLTRESAQRRVLGGGL